MYKAPAHHFPKSAKVWENIYFFKLYFDQNSINIDYFDIKKYLACAEKVSLFANIFIITFYYDFEFLQIVEKSGSITMLNCQNSKS